MTSTLKILLGAAAVSVILFCSAGFAFTVYHGYPVVRDAAAHGYWVVKEAAYHGYQVFTREAVQLGGSARGGGGMVISGGGTRNPNLGP
jgi:hypothetical protein